MNELIPTFDCDNCGDCCKSSVIPWLPADIRRIAREGLLNGVKFFRMPPQKFHKYPKVYSEKEYKKLTTTYRYTCSFLGSDNKCTIYEFRPKVCRAFSNIKYCLENRHTFGCEKFANIMPEMRGRFQDER